MEHFNEKITHSRSYIAIASVVLVFIMIIGFFECSKVINQSFTKTLQESMSLSCKNAIENLSGYIILEQQSVDYIADLMGSDDEDTTPFCYADTINALNSFCTSNAVASSGILYEDGHLLMNDGSNFYNGPDLSFPEVSSNVSYISSMVDSDESSTGKVIRIFAPIKDDGRVSAMLFVTLDPAYFSHFFGSMSDYSSDKILLIADAADNRIIYSTYGGSDPDLQSLTTGSLIEAFSLSKVSHGMLSSMKVGDSGQEWDYYSRSFSLGEWCAITMVKHNTGFALVDDVTSTLIKAFLIMLIPLLLFLILVIAIEHRTVLITRTFSDSVSYMYRVGFSLTNAAMDPDRINDALGIMAEQYSGRSATFLIVRFGKIRDIFSTDRDFERRSKKLTTGTSLKNSSPEFYEHLLAGDCIVVNLPELDELDHTDDLSVQIKAGKILGIMPARGMSAQEETISETEMEDVAFEHFSSRVVSMNSDRTPVFRMIPGTVLMCVPIRGSENTLTGILIVSDPQLPERQLTKFTSFSYIHSVAPDFSMVSTSVEAYAIIKNMGSIDFTTGLLNRNAYKKALEELEIEDGRPFACIFIDVNGLHEMNNTFGHDKGDEMLHYVADTLKTVFPDDEVYRIGGDEFLIFAKDHSMSVIDLRVAHINRLIEEAKYAVSIGVEWREHDHNISEMITAADHKMYAAKKRYYETAGRDRRSRDRRSDDRGGEERRGADRRAGDRRAEDRRSDDRRSEDRRSGDRRSDGEPGIIITPGYTGPDRRRRDPDPSKAPEAVKDDIQSIMDKYRPSGAHKGNVTEVLAEAEQAAQRFAEECGATDTPAPPENPHATPSHDGEKSVPPEMPGGPTRSALYNYSVDNH